MRKIHDIFSEKCPHCDKDIENFTYGGWGCAVVKPEEILNLECEGWGATIHHIYEGGKCKLCGRAGCTHPDCMGYNLKSKLCIECREYSKIE